MRWECREGHQWDANFGHIKNRGSWCRICAKGSMGSGRRRSLAEIQELAASKGGKCLSNSYENNQRPVKWECGFGHQWSASAHQVQHQGTWCPDCAPTKKKRSRTRRPLRLGEEGAV
jgi:hypothetical protein